MADGLQWSRCGRMFAHLLTLSNIAVKHLFSVSLSNKIYCETGPKLNQMSTWIRRGVISLKAFGWIMFTGPFLKATWKHYQLQPSSKTNVRTTHDINPQIQCQLLLGCSNASRSYGNLEIMEILTFDFLHTIQPVSEKSYISLRGGQSRKRFKSSHFTGAWALEFNVKLTLAFTAPQRCPSEYIIYHVHALFIKERDICLFGGIVSFAFMKFIDINYISVPLLLDAFLCSHH